VPKANAKAASPEAPKSAGPHIPAHVSVAEVTVKGVLLGLFLAVVLGAANTYLGLKAGLTVSASIPAAVISLGVLRTLSRLFGLKHSILENNMVQTIASAGEAVAGGLLFTIPALLIMGYWKDGHVHYWQTTAVAIVGGLLGVLFTVPLRRALIVEENLAFPEGVATAEVLKAGENGSSGVGSLLLGGLVGAGYKFLESGMQLWSEGVLYVQRFGSRTLAGLGANLSPALFGVGAIVGLRIAVLIFGGGALGWLVGIPLYSATHPGSPDLAGIGPGSSLSDLQGAATNLWKHQVRYLGVGAMLVGGVWSLIKLRKPLARAMTTGLRGVGTDATGKPLRTEHELSARTTFVGVALLTIPMALFYAAFTNSAIVGITMAVIMVVTGFLFSAVGAYMAGIVGSSNNPISGVTILTLIVSAFALKALGVDAGLGPPATILVAAVIAVAGSIASDNLQDLKAGHLLGSTPRKQQLMLMLGAVAAAFVMAPVLQILVDGVRDHGGIGGPSLPAPQSNLMASIATGIFDPKAGALPYAMVGIGAVIAVGLILLDGVLVRAGSTFRTPVMPVAVGIYLPIQLSVPILIGGLVAEGVAVFYGRRQRAAGPQPEGDIIDLRERGGQAIVLVASGLIAGEALVGIVTSAIAAGPKPNLLVATHGQPYDWAGIVLGLYVVFLLGYAGVRPWLAARRQSP
jgi:putative OPT family oligopeptide transporter